MINNDKMEKKKIIPRKSNIKIITEFDHHLDETDQSEIFFYMKFQIKDLLDKNSVSDLNS